MVYHGACVVLLVAVPYMPDDCMAGSDDTPVIQRISIGGGLFTFSVAVRDELGNQVVCRFSQYLPVYGNRMHGKRIHVRNE